MADWNERKAAGMAAAQETLDTREDAASLRSGVVGWIAATRDCESDLSGLAKHPATDHLAAQFEAGGLTDAAECLRTIDVREGPIKAGRWVLARLLGLGAADDFVHGLVAGELRDIRSWSLDSYGAWDVAMQEIPNLLTTNAAARSAFWTQMDALTARVVADPGIYCMKSHKAGVRASVAAYRESPSIIEAWQTDLNSCVYFEDSHLFWIARNLDAKHFLQSASQLPHPVYMNDCLAGIDPANTQTFVYLIEHAPPALEGNNYDAAGAMVACLLQAAASAIREQAWRKIKQWSATALNQSAAEEETVREIVASFAEMLDALFRRNDAQFLGWNWMERLIYEGERRGIWRPDGGVSLEPTVDVLALLINNLAPRLAQLPDEIGWINEREPLWRVDRMAAIVASKAIKANDNEARDCFGDLLRQIQPAYAGFGEAIRSDRIIGKICAASILLSTNPAASIVDLWDDIRPIRERAWRGIVGEERNNVGELAVLSMMLAMEQANGATKAALWCSLASVLESAVRTEVKISIGDFWSDATKRLACSIPCVLTDSEPDKTEVVSDFLRPHICSDAAFFELVFCLERQGVKAELVDKALEREGTSLRELATQFFTFEGLHIARKHYSEKWLDRVRSLAMPIIAAS